MATTTDTRAAFSDEQLQELVGLIQEADSVELKLTVPDADQSSTLRALEVDPLQAQIRQVFFFDTPGLDLDKQGLVVRARRSQKKGDDTVVKLRPVVPSELPKSLRRSPNFGVEVDASPEGFVCSGSLKGVPKIGEVQKAAPASFRFASSSRRSSGRSSPSMPPRESASTISRSSARSSSSS